MWRCIYKDCAVPYLLMSRQLLLSLLLSLVLSGFCLPGRAITPTWAELMTAGRQAHHTGRYDEAKELLGWR